MASANAAADEALVRLEQLRRGLNKHIRDLLLKLAAKDGVLRRDDVVNAYEVSTQVLEAMRARGALVVPSIMEEAAAKVVTTMLRPGAAPPGFAARVGPELDAIVRGSTRVAAQVFGQYIDEVRQAIDRGLTTSMNLSDLIDDVASRVDASFARVASAVDTGIIGVGRTIIIEQAEASAALGGEEMVYKYIGPRDSKTRPFCARYIDGYYTRAYLDSLDNGPRQPKPVSRYLGGWLCRHSLAPIPRFLVEEQGKEINPVR
jgi:hypothetical protein